METIKTTNPDLKGTLILPDPGRLMRVPVAELQEPETTPAPTSSELDQAAEAAKEVEAAEAASTAVGQPIVVGTPAPKAGESTTYTGNVAPPAAQTQAPPQAGILNTFDPATQPVLSGGSMGTTLQQGPASPIAVAQPTLAATITSVPATAPSVNGPAPELVAANQVAQQTALDQGLPPPPPISNGPPAELIPGSTIPVISIDTSEPALAADGLGETAPDTLPTLGEAYRSANRAPSTRRLPRRQPSPQPSYASGPSEPSEPSAPQKSQAPVRVIKEG